MDVSNDVLTFSCLIHLLIGNLRDYLVFSIAVIMANTPQDNQIPVLISQPPPQSWGCQPRSAKVDLSLSFFLLQIVFLTCLLDYFGLLSRASQKSRGEGKSNMCRGKSGGILYDSICNTWSLFTTKFEY